MRYDLIAKVIQDAGFGTMGTDIFIHRMDAECVAGIMIRGPLDGIPTDDNLPDYYRGTLQIIIRNADQVAGDDIARRLAPVIEMQRRVFTDTDGSVLIDVKQIYLTKLPIIYMRSVGRSIEWSLNFKTYYVMPA
jgi:hypothetical protein